MAGESIRAIERAFNILDVFSDEAPTLSLSEISTLVDLPMTTVFRILQTLENRGVVSKSNDGMYQLGLVFLKYERVLIKSLNIRNQAREVMQELRDKSQETVNLYIERGMKRVCIANLEYGTSRLSYKVAIGDVLPLHLGASGKVILANKPQGYWQSYYEKYQEDINLRVAPNYKKFKMLLEKIMADGYDVSAGEREPGINSISAPIKNHEGMLIGALTITGPNIRISNDRVESFKKMLMEGAREISANMGFVDE